MATVYSLVCENGSSGSYWSNLSTSDRLRYGPAGSERVFSGLRDWNTSRYANAISTDYEICEIADAFVDVVAFTLSVPSIGIKITTSVNGQRSAAFHNGVVGAGYTLQRSNGGTCLYVRGTLPELDGFAVAGAHTDVRCLYISEVGSIVKNMIITGVGAATSTGEGIWVTQYAKAAKIYNNIVLGHQKGIILQEALSNTIVSNNLVVKNDIGFAPVYDYRTTGAWYYNNIAIGNNINWYQNGGCVRGGNNFGSISDRQAITGVDTDTNELTVPGHIFPTNARVVFGVDPGGVLPSPLVPGKKYYIRVQTDNTMTLTTTYNSGAGYVYLTDEGSGSFWVSNIWSVNDAGLIMDIADAGNIFADYDNNDFRPASAAAPQVDAGIPHYDFDYSDILGNVRPNYESATYPANYVDAGPFEFDHGNGLAPKTVSIEISGIITGSDLAIYKPSDNTEIVAPTTISGTSFSTTYTYTGNTTVTVKIRNASGTTKYKPYTAQGVIGENGLSMIVAQIEDPIAS